MFEVKNLRLFEKKDAEAISELFKIVYGDSYTYPEIYKPATIYEKNKLGIWQSMVAISSEEEILGHAALWKHSRCPQIPETALLAVHPEVRNSGLAAKISLEVINLAKKIGYKGLTVNQVCHHPFSQRLIGSFTCFHLSLWPDYVKSPFSSNTKRESIICSYMPLEIQSKKELFLPTELVPIARSLTDGLDEIKTIDSPVIASPPTHLHSKIEILKEELEILELHIDHWGIDGELRLKAMDSNQITFVLINAEFHENILACKYLLSSGFAFMGLAPGHFPTWAWLFAKNFSPEIPHIVNEKIRSLVQESTLV